MKKNRFDIDFFEFSFLCEACIPPVPIARGYFWQKVIDEYYYVLTENERYKLFQWIYRNIRFNTVNEDCALFAARYDPNNQYKITAIDKGKTYINDCFKWQDKYHIKKNTFVEPNYITEVTQIINKFYNTTV